MAPVTPQIFFLQHIDGGMNVPQTLDIHTSGPVVAMVWEGEGVIAGARVLIGATKPLAAAPGNIRGDLAVDIGRNVVHGSDGPDTAQFEIGLWFQPEELTSWQPADQSWRTES